MLNNTALYLFPLTPMKKLLFSCFVLLLLTGCGTNPTDQKAEKAETPPLPAQQTRIDGKHVFINATPLDKEFVDFIQTFSPDTLPATYGEILAPQGIQSPIKIISIKPIDFVALGYSGKIAEYERSEVKLMFYFDHPAGLFWGRDNFGKYGTINEEGYNDFYVLHIQTLQEDVATYRPTNQEEETINNIEILEDITVISTKTTKRTATLYKNFEVLYTGEHLQDYIINPKREVYLMEAEYDDDFYRYHSATITKDGKELARIASGYVKLL
jgi:hypothetical protein